MIPSVLISSYPILLRLTTQVSQLQLAFIFILQIARSTCKSEMLWEWLKSLHYASWQCRTSRNGNVQQHSSHRGGTDDIIIVCSYRYKFDMSMCLHCTRIHPFAAVTVNHPHATHPYCRRNHGHNSHHRAGKSIPTHLNKLYAIKSVLLTVYMFSFFHC